ncbi:LOW QUALITY PROTEIN: hypothetical protein CFOL_v3_32099, partial [Cephalotus follicularis]
FIHLIEKITYQKWHINITITIQDSFKLQTIALIDSAQMNCIQEGLILTKYFEKTKQRLSTHNGENLRVKFKISNVHICNEGICIKQSFILVKDLDIGIILGCATFYVNKNSEIERGTPRLVINYKPLNTALQWI